MSNEQTRGLSPVNAEDAVGDKGRPPEIFQAVRGDRVTSKSAMTCYVIERDFHCDPHYLTADGWKNPAWRWSSDFHAAIRFSRRSDAMLIAGMVGNVLHGRISEWLFSDTGSRIIKYNEGYGPSDASMDMIQPPSLSPDKTNDGLDVVG